MPDRVRDGNVVAMRNGPAGGGEPDGDPWVPRAGRSAHAGDTVAGESGDLRTGNPGWESA
ncbi:hypothetical protein LX15_005813 [Streptoalloteichus tenebrarius]|uniref:Uncharacterized protein n=1 Tax=Streptoalloteichus tenebrarius (strain ATCC 17920 / DSM 40477 / JCM 4838 / CBS 697.72 / NBRC 16177 / NCIMB 11028 / NRRL B-12390 / A12253. 1 / ISP 5477) TaxID=1933 RepID=A0ABT1I2R8_STRSD|nr:hypothetical protein [Streptoalloteichus tenebrarius]BFF02235.1 hypothetical protein GCM10020241_39100 [Streptoalloteichus tenebrarius]